MNNLYKCSLLKSIKVTCYNTFCSEQRQYWDEEDDDNDEVADSNDDDDDDGEDNEDNDEDDDDIVCLVSAEGYSEVTSQARVLSEHQLSPQIMIIIIFIIVTTKTNFLPKK